jgi:ADP-heptose:LPS heptosyltransferase
MSHPVLRDVRKIAVFRPNAVGDFMYCLPALQAIKHTYPDAEVVYLGQAWHAEFLADRPGPVDRTVVIPALPWIYEAADERCNMKAVDSFLEGMRGEHFDLALQMYGGGRYANPFVAQFGARTTVGMRTPDAAPLDRCIAYGALVNRRLQLLEVAALAGARFWPMTPQLKATSLDRALAAQLIPPNAGERLVIVQPGASDARRCWSPVRFAAVADALVEEGALVAINGSDREEAIVAEVIRAMHHRAINLSGQASLKALCGLVERATLVLSNDTGPLHMALALGRPCVGIYWFTNLIEAAPLCQEGHRAALSMRIHCPVCGMENTASRCEHNASFVDDVSLEEVTALSIDLFRSVC